jgi:hypothetical protein
MFSPSELPLTDDKTNLSLASKAETLAKLQDSIRFLRLFATDVPKVKRFELLVADGSNVGSGYGGGL